MCTETPKCRDFCATTTIGTRKRMLSANLVCHLYTTPRCMAAVAKSVTGPEPALRDHTTEATPPPAIAQATAMQAWIWVFCLTQFRRADDAPGKQTDSCKWPENAPLKPSPALRVCLDLPRFASQTKNGCTPRRHRPLGEVI